MGLNVGAGYFIPIAKSWYVEPHARIGGSAANYHTFEKSTTNEASLLKVQTDQLQFTGGVQFHYFLQRWRLRVDVADYFTRQWRTSEESSVNPQTSNLTSNTLAIRPAVDYFVNSQLYFTLSSRYIFQTVSLLPANGVETLQEGGAYRLRLGVNYIWGR